jgi:hypothetical protein
MPGERTGGLSVEIDLTDEGHLRLTAEDSELGDWPLNEITILALDDGIHLRADGDEVVLETDNDAAFAVEVGLRSGPPVLRRQMAALLRQDPRFHPMPENQG